MSQYSGSMRLVQDEQKKILNARVWPTLASIGSKCKSNHFSVSGCDRIRRRKEYRSSWSIGSYRFTSSRRKLSFSINLFIIRRWRIRICNLLVRIVRYLIIIIGIAIAFVSAFRALHLIPENMQGLVLQWNDANGSDLIASRIMSTIMNQTS